MFLLMWLVQALFLPVSKKLKAQKTQKISASKKTQGPFWAKNSVCWSQFEISAKKLWNFDHLKPILTDFMVKNETFKDFLIILAQNSCIWGEMFKILKKTLKILRKNSTIWKKTQCYGVFRTQCDSLKSVKKSLLGLLKKREFNVAGWSALRWIIMVRRTPFTLIWPTRRASVRTLVLKILVRMRAVTPRLPTNIKLSQTRSTLMTSTSTWLQ